MLETASVFNYFRSVARQPRAQGKRTLVLVDSQVALGVCAKGRSSSRALNNVLSRLGALLSAANLQAVYAWVATALNPADGPSRWSWGKQQ